MSHQQFAEELHKQIIRKLEQHKVYSFFKDNIWDVNLANMQLTIKCNKQIRFVMCY